MSRSDWALPRRAERPPLIERERVNVPKLCGADIELGNFILGAADRERTDAEAAQQLLGALRSSAGAVGGNGGLARHVPARGGYDPRDWGRSHLPANGGCAYIDLDHLELCLPEVRSAYDHVACWHAMLRLAQDALAAANARQPAGRRVTALVNNSDGRGNSYGSHLNFLVTRRAWNDVVHRRLHYQAYLAAFQVSSMVYTGQGKVGSENGARHVPYQIAQRADFFEAVAGPQTTYRRPLVNTRDEPLCGLPPRGRRRPEGSDAGDLARLHVIFFDSTLCHVPSLLKVGAMQIVLAMIEAGRVRADLALDDPLAAVRAWSHDPLLETRMPLVSGEPVTAPELQLRFLDEAERHVASGALDELVPRAAEIASLWADTLDRLRRRDWPSLARRLDWVLKLSLLEGAMRQRPALGWSAPEVKHLDHLYASLDPAEGLFWSLAGRGLLEEVVERADVERFTHEPPADTRAWGRAMLLRRAPQDAIDLVDWDFIRFRLRRPGGPPSYWALDLGGPLESTRDKLGPVLERTQTLEQLLFALGGQTERRAGYGGGTIHQDRTALPPPGPASRGSARPGPR